MVYTVTFNPAIDYVMHLPKVVLGEVNRSASEEFFFGGKGINVSCVLKNLGVPSVALGFVAGFTGKAIEEGVSAAGIEADFVHIDKGMSRINVKIKASEESEINGCGPDIGEADIAALMEKLDLIKAGDTLVLAGSIPSSLPGDMYEKIMARLDGRGIRIAVDATKDLLMNVMKYHPFLVKPNNHELAEMFNVEIKSIDDVIANARRLRDMGGVNVLVSMAGDGAVLLDEKDNVHIIGVPHGKVVNSVGAGDSMVAGFLAGINATGDYEYALRLGTAAGSATAFSAGLGTKDEIMALLATL